VTRRDPRAELALLAMGIAAILAGGPVGIAAVVLALAALSLRAGTRRVRYRAVVALLPLAAAVAILDTLAGDPARGALEAARLLALVALGAFFAQRSDGERLVAGLQALRVPFALSFVLVAGARFVPVAAADIRELRDAARLRGLAIDGTIGRQLAGWRLLIVPLLVTTVRRGLQLGEAMELRAFGVGPRGAGDARLRWTAADTLVCLLGLGALVAVLGASVR
jgi:energy-coupling factor transporter transmembrane protein EcfT